MRRYGLLSAQKEVAERCIAEVSEPPHYIYRSQCSRKRGHGPVGLYCKQHAAMIAQGKVVPVGREEDEKS